MCPSREDKQISPSLETIDKRSRTLGFSTRLPNSSSNGTSTGEGSKGTKFKSGTTKKSRSEVKTILEKGSISKVFRSKVGFRQFVSYQQKRWRERTSHKFEVFELVYSLQTPQGRIFALSEVYVAKQ